MAMQCQRCRCSESDPKSARIQEPIPVVAHLVFKLLSSTFAGGYEEELELAVTPLIGRFAVQSDGGGDEDEPKISSSAMVAAVA